MAKKTILKERVTNDTLYPVTSAECVLTDSGDTVEDKLDELGYVMGSNPELFRSSKFVAMGSWNYDDLNPDAVDFYGDKSFANCWDFVLIDCDAPANADGTQPIVGKLKRNNLLRFADGSFAPTVGITEAMRAECDVELYLDAEHTQKYCDAGTFNAETFYNEHGMAKLYNSEGAEVRVLRPWETTERKYSVFLATDKDLYPIDRLVGNSGQEWSGVMGVPLRWDGLDVEKFKLAPTGISPSGVCTVDNKSRCFFFVYEPDNNNCKSSNGINDSITMFRNGRTYPRVNDMHQGTAGTRARANNADPTASYPFAEGGQHAFNVFNLCLEAKYGTKNLNNGGKWGTGISSNEGVSTENIWLANGNVRYKVSGASDYEYHTLNTTPTDIFTNASNGKTHWSNWLNREYPKEQCMESQMAMSFANERGIAEGEHFDFYGGEYWYYDVPGTNRDDMSARVYKIMSQQGCPAFDANGAEITFDVDVILRMSLYDGATLSGDIFSYNQGGCYYVGRYSGQNTNNEIQTYLEPDQRKWGQVQTVYKGEADYRWSFEDTYIYLGEHIATGNGWIKHRQPWSANKLSNGGNIITGECAHNYDYTYWGSEREKRYLVGVCSRLEARYTTCSRRSVNCNYGFAYMLCSACASAQVLLPTGWRS